MCIQKYNEVEVLYMKFDASWLLDWGLRVGDGFSSKQEGAKFKQQIKELKDKILSDDPDNSEDVGPEGVQLTQAQHDTGVIIGALVHGVLMDFVKQACHGEEPSYERLVSLVPRVRNTLLTLMVSIKREDVTALRRYLRALDEIEKDPSSVS